MPKNTYQNGAYWAYSTGWYVYALTLVNGQAASDMFEEYLAYLKDWNDDLANCAWECINPALDHYQNAGYLATVALPYAALLQKGLLGEDAVRGRDVAEVGDSKPVLEGVHLPKRKGERLLP